MTTVTSTSPTLASMATDIQSAMKQARSALRILEQEIAPNMPDADQHLIALVARKLEGDVIISEDMLHAIKNLVLKIEAVAKAGTSQFWHCDECHNDGGWIVTLSDARAELLLSASVTLQRLHETIGSVLDTRRAIIIAKAMAAD